jgi:hypothetical protein
MNKEQGRKAATDEGAIPSRRRWARRLTLEVSAIILAGFALVISIGGYAVEGRRANRSERHADARENLAGLRESYSRMTELISKRKHSLASRSELEIIATQASALERQLGDLIMPTDQYFMGTVYISLDRPDLASLLFRTAARESREANDDSGRGLTISSLTALGSAQYSSGKVEEGKESFGSALAATRDLVSGIRTKHRERARVHFEHSASAAIAGRCPEANRHLRKAQAENLKAEYILRVTSEDHYEDFVRLCDRGGSPKDQRPLG